MGLAKLPDSEDDLLSYENNCLEAAIGLADDYKGLKLVTGAFNGSPHAWCVDDQGTIYDAAYHTVTNHPYDATRIADLNHPGHQHYQVY